jgi:hypothetical protein
LARTITKKGHSAFGVKRILPLTVSEKRVGYIVDLVPEGFALFSSDDEAPPLKMYSETGSYDELPPRLRRVLELELLEDSEYIKIRGNQRSLPTKEKFTDLWDYLTSEENQSGAEYFSSDSADTSILTTTWHQNDPYNFYCPVAIGGPGGRALAGCTATALSQVLRHHKKPIAVAQNYTYTDNSGSCTGSHSIGDAGMGAYDWLNMPSSISTASPDAQIRAVGQLIYHCAVALKSNFEAGGTGAYPSSIPSVLSEFFDYTCTDYSRKNSYTSSEWYARISSDIDNNRPVFYTMWEADGGSGHAVVCDGYRNGNEIHLDLGWSGAWTAWYNIDSVVASGHTWTTHSAIFNIQPPSGEGDVEIWTCEQLQQVSIGGAYPRNARYKLMTNIDCSSISNFFPIGHDSDHYFRGTFDGQGHRIYNLKIERPDEPLVGLFAVVMHGSSVKNLRLECQRITGLGDSSSGDGAVGALVGMNAGTIINCHVGLHDLKGMGGNGIGGLAGKNTGIIQACSLDGSDGSEGDIVSEGDDPDYIGGLVGVNTGRIYRCWVGPNVEVDADSRDTHGVRVGGLVGWNWGTILECYSHARRIDGESCVGGIAGATAGGTVSGCYSTNGSIHGDSKVGGLVGDNNGGIVQRSYSSNSATGECAGSLVGEQSASLEDCFWLCGGLPPVGCGTPPDNSRCLTSDEMKHRGDFVAAGWDFVNESTNGAEDTWCICEGGDYPKHTWSFILGDTDGDDDLDFADYANLADHWLQADSSFWCGTGGTNFTDDADGTVNFMDLATMVGQREVID